MNKSEPSIWSCFSLRNLFLKFRYKNGKEKSESRPAKGVPNKYPTNWLVVHKAIF